MKLPNLAYPIRRNKNEIYSKIGINPSSIWDVIKTGLGIATGTSPDPGTLMGAYGTLKSVACPACRGAIQAVGSTVLGLPCSEAVGAFEVACNGALDGIPGIGEGPGEAGCIAGGIALGAACKAGLGTVTQPILDIAKQSACKGMC